jgi:hypothetical protein
MARTTKQDKVRELQRTLYRAAKADPGRRFHALYDKVHRRDVLERAWELVRANKGAAGIDRQTIADVEEYGVAKLLDELAADLKEEKWRPLPARRVFIPKPGRPTERRPLSIPAVRDRVVQAATKIVIEPIFEADMLECSFGFRPKRSAHDALQVLIDEAWRGRRWVAESDIANCFEAIPHSGLMAAIEERISDRHVLKLLRTMLRAGVCRMGRSRAATPARRRAGCSHPAWPMSTCTGSTGSGQTAAQACWSATRMICWSYAEPGAKRRERLRRSRRSSPSSVLSSKQAKTRIVHLTEGGEGLDFLGFHHRWVRGNTPRSRHLCFLARWPSRQATQHARDRIREITDRRRLLVPVEDVVQDVNRFLRGWSGYFRYGNSARHFNKINHYALDRVARFVAKRHKRSRGYGMKVVAYQSSNRLGLINLNGTIVAPRPNRSWRPGR